MTEPKTSSPSTKILRSAIWVAIGALIAAAIVCVVWVLIGDANGIIGKAFLTILLLAAFAGVSIGETNLAPRRPEWFALASMVTWVLILLIGAVMIWMPEQYDRFGGGIDRFARFLLIVLVLQGALLHIRLYSKAHERHPTTFTSVVSYITIGLVVILAVMLVLPILLSEYVTFLDFYWRVVVALAILVAVGTALVPLVNALFAPKKPRPVGAHGGHGAPGAYGAYGAAGAAGAAGYAPAPVAAWPTYADGRTPLPVLPDGTPDWNAYYTGQPSYPPVQPPLVPSAPAGAPGGPAAAAAPGAPEAPEQPSAPTTQPGYTGYPPPPPPPQ